LKYDSRVIKNKNNVIFLTLIVAFVTSSIVITPWLNVDSIVVPKLVIIFGAAMYLLPFLVLNRHLLFSKKPIKILVILSLLMLSQMTLVMVTTSSPLEQQLFGKTGRGLGFLSELSFIIFLIASALFIQIDNLSYFRTGMLFAAIISSIYAILQSNGLDFFDWYTKTNGIIGTLGNPNFQSAFAALALAPSLSLFNRQSLKSSFSSIIFTTILAYTIYICRSTQGYIISFIIIFTNLALLLFYKRKALFAGLSVIIVVALFFTIGGILNSGPLASILYKYSIKSRFEFFRTAISTIKDNPLFGVGLDSFGDYSTIYKSAQDAAGVNEYTDSAHNYFLNYAANGGLLLVTLYILITLLALASFFKIQQKTGRFSKEISMLFAMWLGFQAQSLISPSTLPINLIGMILNGMLIGLFTWSGGGGDSAKKLSNFLIRPFALFFLFLSLIITYPYFNVDRLQLKSLNTNDANLAIKSALSYPQSSVRYQRIGTKLLESNLGVQALDIGRAATKFNPNSIPAWGLILANSTATVSERRYALEQLIRLDPYDTRIREFEKLFNQEFSR
jgi:O-antigen ligase